MFLNKTFLLLSIALSISAFPAVQNFNAFFSHGQTFLSWDENGADKYRIYKSTSPLTLADLTSASFRIAVDSGFGFNRILSDLSDGGIYEPSGWSNLHPPCILRRNILQPLDPSQSGLAQSIPAGRNMIVLTGHSPGTFYYAVTAVTGAVESRTLDAGSIVGPIVEIVEDPHPLLVWQSTAMKARMYLQYCDIDSLNSDSYAWPYWVGVKQRTNTADTGAMEMVLGGGDQHMAYCGDSLDAYTVKDVRVRPTEDWQLWYGHSATFDASTAGSWPYTATSGPIVNYTQARIMNFLRFMMYDEPYYAQRIDTNRLSVAGNSNGGCGALQFCYNYPNVFATARGTCAPTDITRYGQTYWSCFGNPADTGMHVSFRGWKSDYLRRNFEGTRTGAWFDLEAQVLLSPGSSMAFLYTGFGGSDNTISWPGWGKDFITNLHASRRGFCGGLDGPAGHDGPGISPVAQFNVIRLNESYPAFTNVSGNPAIPLLDAPAMVRYEINNQFMWSTPHWRVGGWQNQVDQANRYEIVIASTAGDQTGDITPRRLQHFVAQSGKDYVVKNTAVSDTTILYQVKTITADQYGLVTFQGFQIKAGSQSSGGSRFIMAPVVPVSTKVMALAGDAGPGISCLHNPFNSSFSIHIGSTGHQSPRVLVYNVSGRCVADLSCPAGQGRIVWEGAMRPSGAYFIKVVMGNKTTVRPVTLIQ